MLGVKVSLGTMRARKLSVGILDRDNGILGGASTRSRCSRSARRTRQDASAALRPDDMRRLVVVWHACVGLHHRARPVRRLHPGLRHESSRRHRAQHRRAAAASRGGRDGLRVRDSSSRLLHHGRRGSISRVRLVGILRHRVNTAAARRLGRVRIAGQVVVRVWRVWRAGSARRVRVAPVERLHDRNRRLKGRERVRKRRARVKLIGRHSSWGRIRLRCRSRVYPTG